MPTYRIDLGYDGSGFRGYARNEGVRTVQGVLEAALARVLRTEVVTSVAGRTDAGVHAERQVVSFTADGVLPDLLEKSLRTMLGPEIAIHEIVAVDDEFDARYSATARRYRYLVDDGLVADPMQRNSVWHFPGPLDVAVMDRAAQYFVGEHDFASLCRAREGQTTLRTVFSAGWTRRDRLHFEVHAAAFCHQMVRSMVAICVDVGRGKVDADAVPEILGARDRNAARGAAPPHGLTLVAVEYPVDSEGAADPSES